MHKAVMIIAMAMLALPATAQAQHDDQGKAALKEMAPKWQAAYNAGDAAGVAALYAEDGILLPPNSPPVKGRKAIEVFWAGAIESGGTTELTVQKMYGMGENVTEVGAWVATAADGSHQDHGSYTLVYKQVEGGWQIVSDMWNSDMSE